MFEIFKLNLFVILAMFGMYIASLTAYSLAGYNFNKNIYNHKFCKKKFFLGILDKISEGIVYILLTLVVSITPDLISMLGFELDQAVAQTLSIVIVAGLLFSMVYRYFNMAINKLKSKHNIEESDLINLIPKEVEEVIEVPIQNMIDRGTGE